MEQSSSPRSDLRKKAILFLANLIALLIIRAIIGGISTVKNSSPFGDSLMSPLLLFYAVVDTVLLVVIVDFGITLAGELQSRYPEIPSLRSVLLLFTAVLGLAVAYRIYETPAACLLTQRTALANSLQKSAPGTEKHTADVSGAVLAQNVTGQSLELYRHLAVARFRQSPDIYGWIFLLLITCPIVGSALLVSQSPREFADLLSQLAGRARTRPQFSAVVALSKAFMNAQAVSTGGRSLSREEMLQKIATLKLLRDSRSISDEEFQQQKGNILARDTSDPRPVAPGDFDKLKELLDSGALTEDENQRLKNRFLEQI
jgi:uncharacterized membrane protein